MPATSYFNGLLLNATSFVLLKLKSSISSLLVLISASITPLSFSNSSLLKAGFIIISPNISIAFLNSSSKQLIVYTVDV